MGRHKIPIEDRLWQKVDMSGGPDACWEWLAQRSWVGYGRIGFGKSSLAAHRVTYELMVGPIPEGYEIDHLCRNRGCVNPAHLEAVTPRENVLRSESRAAVNARKTHCVRGHEFTPDNTYRFGPDKRHRSCVECRRFEQSGIPERVDPFRHRPKRSRQRSELVNQD